MQGRCNLCKGERKELIGNSILMGNYCTDCKSKAVSIENKTNQALTAFKHWVNMLGRNIDAERILFNQNTTYNYRIFLPELTVLDKTHVRFYFLQVYDWYTVKTGRLCIGVTAQGNDITLFVEEKPYDSDTSNKKIYCTKGVCSKDSVPKNQSYLFTKVLNEKEEQLREQVNKEIASCYAEEEAHCNCCGEARRYLMYSGIATGSLCEDCLNDMDDIFPNWDNILRPVYKSICDTPILNNYINIQKTELPNKYKKYTLLYAEGDNFRYPTFVYAGFREVKDNYFDLVKISLLPYDKNKEVVCFATMFIFSRGNDPCLIRYYINSNTKKVMQKVSTNTKVRNIEVFTGMSKYLQYFERYANDGYQKWWK